MSKRIVYIQYTNPAGYPPLEHSSMILARRGWQVLFLGVQSTGTRGFVFPHQGGIEVRLLESVKPGWRQKIHYFWFCVWAVVSVLLRRPHWVYASDLMSSPVACLCRMLGIQTVYHEHDAPGEQSLRGAVGRLLAFTRRRAGQVADIVAIPNAERARVFRETLKSRETSVVWNCPRREEVRENNPGAGIKLLYHGSINAARLPLTLIGALRLLPDKVSLRIGGYETIGSRGYLDEFRKHAESQGLEARRIEIMPPVPARNELMDLCAGAQIGIGFLPRLSGDINMTAMFGASNKVFDYMACGLALIVSDQPGWAGPLVASGTAVACNPEDPSSIANAVQSLIRNPAELRQRGERGRQLILDGWNYEAQFQPLLAALEKT